MDLIPHLQTALSNTSSPDRAHVNFERLARAAQDQPELFRFLADHPRAADNLATLFDASQFLTEILLNDPNFVELLAVQANLVRHKGTEEYFVEALASIDSLQTITDRQDALRRYQRRELLRIGACDLLDLYDLPSVTRQLSNLAEGLVRACLQSISAHLEIPTAGFVVIAMGKLGGQELNYSSDIDLLFLCRRDTERYRRLGEKLIEALSRITSGGFLYRVDMRLRPWGQVGPLVPSLKGYRDYLKNHARMWEKQALLKARIVAGDESVGVEFLDSLRSELFASDGEAVRINLHAMKQRTEDHLRQAGRGWGEVKLGEGSIRDIEFITQYLQLAHGSRHPNILSTNTLQALARLFDHRLLSADEYQVLVNGYVFLRTVEHHLQMMNYQQTHRLPEENDPESLAQLARRLGFLGPDAGSHFVLRYQQHCTAIRDIYLKRIENGDQGNSAPQTPARQADIPKHLLHMHPSYEVTFSQEAIARHADLAERLGNDHLVDVEAAPLGENRWRITIVAYDFPGELSLICGLLFIYNLDILDGFVFTYEPPTSPLNGLQSPDQRRKIVDVFTVRPIDGEPPAEIWSRYQADLAGLLRWMQLGHGRQAHTELVKRVALSLPDASERDSRLYPIEIEIDNTSSGRSTILRIESHDTPGFLYELANALAEHQVYIARMTVDTVDTRVKDVFYVTNFAGEKINDPEKQRELRAAVVLIKHFTHLLPHSPNPESALVHFRELMDQLLSRPGWPDELASIEKPQVLRALADLLGVSDFLWDDFLRMQYANLFPVMREVDALASPKTKDQYQAEMAEAIYADSQNWKTALNVMKDRELFRADMRNILGHTHEFDQFSKELTDLAEVVVETAYRCIFDELASEYGRPMLEDGSPGSMCICALGKCGGRELGYASDIELLFIYAGNGQTVGPKKITSAEFYEKLVQSFIGAVRARQEGIFHVDLQLRPYGKAGSMAVSLDAFKHYYSPAGPAWAYERQALIKLRPVAGDQELGRQILTYRDAFIYHGASFDVIAMRAMRERQIRHLVGGGTFNAKFSPGGLLDIEYLVQGLQITHGHKKESVRATNTREAMAALAAEGIIPPDLYTRLRKAHTFFRWLIDSLRVVRGNAKDMAVPSSGSDEFAFLARRLRYGRDLSRLSQDLNRYSTDVQKINRQLFG